MPKMPNLNEPGLDLLWTAYEMSPVIRRSPRQVQNMLTQGHLPGAKKVGGQWVISERVLRNLFLQPEAA